MLSTSGYLQQSRVSSASSKAENTHETPISCSSVTMLRCPFPSILHLRAPHFLFNLAPHPHGNPFEPHRKLSHWLRCDLLYLPYLAPAPTFHNSSGPSRIGVVVADPVAAVPWPLAALLPDARAARTRIQNGKEQVVERSMLIGPPGPHVGAYNLPTSTWSVCRPDFQSGLGCERTGVVALTLPAAERA